MNDKIDLIKLWIEKADHDLGTAEITWLHIPQYKDTISFHCQQAVEKYLKAYLIFLDFPFKKVHDLTYLLGLIGQKETITNDLYDKAAELEESSVQIRYPDIVIDLSDEDIVNAIAISKEFRQFALSRMNLKIDIDEIS